MPRTTRDPARRPPPGVRPLCAPRRSGLATWAGGIGVGLLFLVAGTTGATVGVAVFGAVVLLVCAGFLTLVLRTRVVLHGTRLHVGGPLGWHPVVDLDRLASLRVLTAKRSLVRRSRPGLVVLVDRDGGQAALENRNTDLGPLLREICARIPEGDTRIDDPANTLRPYRARVT